MNPAVAQLLKTRECVSSSTPVAKKKKEEMKRKEIHT